jgi:hypothetical protein
VRMVARTVPAIEERDVLDVLSRLVSKFLVTIGLDPEDDRLLSRSARERGVSRSEIVSGRWLLLECSHRQTIANHQSLRALANACALSPESRHYKEAIATSKRRARDGDFRSRRYQRLFPFCSTLVPVLLTT